MAITINGTNGITYPDTSVQATGYGSRNLVATLSGTGVASLATTTAITTAYRDYEIEFRNLLPVTQSVTLYLQLYAGGSYLTGTYYNMGYGLFNNNSGAFHTGATSAIQLVYTGYFINGYGSGISGTIRLPNAASATYKNFMYNIYGPTYTSGYTALYIGGGFYTAAAAALTGFQLYASSGNITGSVYVYGNN